MSLLPGRPPSWRLSLLRMAHLNLGLLTFGMSLALMLRAGVGLGPWDVFHQGVALRTPLSIGQVMVLAGLGLVGFSALVARLRPGIGTVLNMATVGLWVDLFLALPAFPSAAGGFAGAWLFVVGLVLNGFATGLYLTAGLGAGPRDGFALALARIARQPVGSARTAVEIVVCLVGWLLGGTVGVGTAVFAVAIGPLMQANLRLLGGLEAAYGRATEDALARRAALGRHP